MEKPRVVRANELMQLHGSHTDTINALWNIYAVVAFAFVGFVYNDALDRIDGPVTVVLTFFFLIFAYGNAAAISRSQNILVALTGAIRGIEAGNDDDSVLLSAFAAKSTSQIRLAHAIFSLLVVFAVWLPSWFDYGGAGAG